MCEIMIIMFKMLSMKIMTESSYNLYSNRIDGVNPLFKTGLPGFLNFLRPPRMGIP